MKELTEAQTVAALRRLARGWPKGLVLVVQNDSVQLRREEEDQEDCAALLVVESFSGIRGNSCA